MAAAEPSKRRRLQAPSVDIVLAATSTSHPYGMQPRGNLMALAGRRGVVNTRDAGLGVLAGLPDQAALALLGALDGRTLARFSRASRGSYVWAHCIDLWRALVLGAFGGAFTWAGSWKGTYVATATGCAPAAARHVPMALPGFYSDELRQAHHVATLPLAAKWLQGQEVPEEDAAALPLAAFRERYEVPGRPVLLQGLVQSWPAASWTVAGLAAAHPQVPVTCGHFDVPLGTYAAYSASVNGAPGAQPAWDDQPLYLFDKHFTQRLPGAAEGYTVPEYFQEDLFSVLGADRPHFRWLIAGPAGSGSSFHVDPNATSAWNAVLAGRKKWIMYPPHMTPPGVHLSSDGAQVAAPLSLVEWFEDFYEAHREVKERAWAACRAAGLDPVASGQAPLEFIAPAGSLLFVPSGWFHMALNLAPDTLAITQNFASSANIATVAAFLRHKPEQVSGVPPAAAASLGERWEAALAAQRPAAAAVLAQAREAAAAAAAAAEAKYRTTTTAWGTLLGGSKRERGEAGFSFGFSL